MSLKRKREVTADTSIKNRWVYERDKAGHGGDCGNNWYVKPENSKTGDYHNVSNDGRVLWGIDFLI